MQRIALCQGKYSITPDYINVANRDEHHAISHFKTKDEIASKISFDKGASRKMNGKPGTYRGRHAEEIKLKEIVITDINSKSKISGCECKGACVH